MDYSVLCIEDDLVTQTLIKETLKDLSVTFASSIKIAEQLVGQKNYNALLIDIELPDGDGLKFYSRLAHHPDYQAIPALFLSGQSDISSKILALTLGADDYITKPFNPLELRARLLSKIQKSQRAMNTERIKTYGDLILDKDLQKVFHLKNGIKQDLNLTFIEIKLLFLLTRKPGQVFTREQILEEVWGETIVSPRTVDSHLAHLRMKLKSSEVQIKSMKNYGYFVSLGHPDT